MAYIAVVMPDVEEGADTKDNLFWCVREDQIEARIRDCGRANPQFAICVYHLTEIRKISKQPEYTRYRVTANGEIVPA